MTALLTRSSAGGVGQAPRLRKPPVDREAALLGRPMPDDRVRALIVTLVLTAIGALVRLQNLEDRKSVV